MGMGVTAGTIETRMIKTEFTPESLDKFLKEKGGMTY